MTPEDSRPIRKSVVENRRSLGQLHEMNFLDFLSPITRQERKALLAVSALGILISYTGLIPTRISALGVDFEKTDRRALLAMLALTIVYFLLTFCIYAMADFVAWRAAYNRALLDHLRNEPAWIPEEESMGNVYQDSINRRLGRWVRRGRDVSGIRAFWEFGFPILCGVFSIIIIFITRHRLC